MDHKTFSGKPFQNEEHIVNADETYLFCQHWTSNQSIKFLLLILHGYGSHGGRFAELAKALSNHGGYVFAHDYEGFGESEGPRGTVVTYQTLIRDAVLHVKEKKALFPNVPVFLCGQSMGGALAVLISHQHPELIDGIITLSGMLAVPADLAPWYKRKLVSGVGNLVPSLTIVNMDASFDSRDEEQVKIASDDKLKIHTLNAGMTLQILKIGEAVEEAIPSYKGNFIAFHGSGDRVCDVSVSKNFYEKSPSLQKKLQIYEDCYHDLLHDLSPTPENLIKDIRAWIDGQLR